MVKNLSTNAGDIRDIGSICGSVRSPEEGNATLSSILAWEIPWIEEPGGVQSMRFKESDVNCQYEALIYLFLT